MRENRGSATMAAWFVAGALALAFAVAAYGGTRSGGAVDLGTTRVDAAAAYWDTTEALGRIDWDVEDVLLHARLRTRDELVAQLRDLAQRAAAESASLAPFALRGALLERRDWLRAAIDEQVATLRRTASNVRVEGPTAARRASPLLLRQSEAISTARGRYWVMLQAGA